MAAFSSKSNFATVVKFFNTIDFFPCFSWNPNAFY